nr:hypothetical protein [Tanacetum cinerariifolium]
TTRSTADQETVNATTVTNAQLQEMIDQGVTTALAARDALRSTNGNNSHNSGTGVRRTKRATRECTYTDFLKCQPLPFKGTEGVASLSQWCERMESNTHIQTVGHEAAYDMTWKTLMKMMTDKYCPRNEIRKLEMELWDMKVKGTNLASYTQHFQELALLCGRMFSEESDKIEKYVGGLPDMIHGMSKRKFENTSRNIKNQQQQHSNKRPNTGLVYTAASGEKKQYVGSRPLCAKCNYHHDGPCAPKCRNCNKIGHLARDCRNTANTNNANNQRGTELGQKPTCYEYGVQGHFRRECPKLKNNNYHGNQCGRNNAPARVYAVGRAGADPDANVVTGTFLLNNRYASILFDTARDALRSTNGDVSHNSGTGVRRTERAARECTYTDFLKCQPLPFKGTEGVASLSQWCERIESTVGHEAAYGMTWKTLMKMMTEKYCPRNEIKKLEMELWELKVKEADKIEKYVGGLPDMIHGSVVASKPKTMQEAIEIATELMDKKIHTFAERETASKRKFENTSRNTQNQQQQQQHSNKRQNTGRAYTAASGEKKQYGGSKPLCAKCSYHHDGPCAPKCRNCKKIGHSTRDCRNAANTNNANN